SMGGRGDAPQLIIPSLRGDEGYMTLSSAFVDAGGLDYTSLPPITFNARGASAVDVADVDGNGYPDVLFAVHRKGETAFSTKSPLFLGTPLGMRETPDHEFPTTGASDVLLRDLDGDGYKDVVFAQERKGTDDYAINSTLFWGSEDGWSDLPDLEFSTSGATGVVAADLDGDGDLDLAFSCYRAVSTVTQSMVFLQNASGTYGADPSYSLPTRGARAVTAGDVDGDGHVDLVFANSIYQGFAETASFVYWGKAGGGYENVPAQFQSSGAEDVLLEDLDGDEDLDIVLANQWDDGLNRDIDSF
ncbi:MAG: hypothetical protein GWN18_15365, partial [Thermoplasmata archaeon]|nr:VCBS repeat-containing protein [Thermoplasmata archaeon]NIS13443.1 VCBS repeat-containing protein [Thermoplasmata archaeon]NIS21324.1 VCBS repeat-containing protein [Thermoplasmata archaeon]NIT78847.1 VCBS repeat-containing protein [Thermoplasmata archaeon]NIU50377.1 VCBS repeat-containing protein [Thermoplasmata archaeon]